MLKVLGSGSILLVAAGDCFSFLLWQGEEMPQTTPKDDLKRLMKESIREVLREERLGLCEILIPHVSKKELIEIPTKFGSPADYGENDFTDLTDWVKG